MSLENSIEKVADSTDQLVDVITILINKIEALNKSNYSKDNDIIPEEKIITDKQKVVTDEKPKRRKRRTKAQIEADKKAAENKDVSDVSNVPDVSENSNLDFLNEDNENNEEEYSQDDVIKKLVAVVKAFGKPKGPEISAKICKVTGGADKVKNIKPENYSAVIEACDRAIEVAKK